MSNDLCQHDGNRVLLVEGKDDCHVVMALCKSHDVPEEFGIYQCGSDLNVLKRLNALIIKPDGPTRIGIVLDADRSPASNRWTQITNKLEHYDYDFPASLSSGGVIICSDTTNLPSIGCWIMPNNQDIGALEDFCIEMADDEMFDHARNTTQNAKKHGYAKFTNNHLNKAYIHTYLAWQETPGQPMGLAITTKALEPDTSIASEFTTWLVNLFCQ